MSQLSPDLTPQQPEQPDPLLVPPAPAVIPVPPSAAWPPATRLAFRFAFCYFLLYALCCGNATIWEIIPKVGAYITNWLSWTFFHSAQWLGQHLFHLTGVGAKLTPTGKDAKTNGTLTLARVPLPSHYPLLDRGFHFVNEWGLER